ncbi:hypothetical protein SAMN05421636_101332 [Pricia antarctica]|uniref:Uncharacterized protein n=1 Tax=Pricia antarctica TaxID=641691 RepID=A0A1G6WJ16_9FLAO|nr:hypothetical protein SAMN05421636_101332 [Pricia antarctica]
MILERYGDYLESIVAYNDYSNKLNVKLSGRGRTKQPFAF